LVWLSPFGTAIEQRTIPNVRISIELFRTLCPVTYHPLLA
jgi:hypothetical protein